MKIPIMNSKQVIVIRKDLNMRKGKMIAQGAHASMKAFIDRGIFDNLTFPSTLHIELDAAMEDWLLGTFTKVCVGVDSEEELLDILRKAEDSGLLCSLIKDSGKTEFGGVPTYTAVAIGPDHADEIDKITGHLRLL